MRAPGEFARYKPRKSTVAHHEEVLAIKIIFDGWGGGHCFLRLPTVGTDPRNLRATESHVMYLIRSKSGFSLWYADMFEDRYCSAEGDEPKTITTVTVGRASDALDMSVGVKDSTGPVDTGLTSNTFAESKVEALRLANTQGGSADDVARRAAAYFEFLTGCIAPRLVGQDPKAGKVVMQPKGEVSGRAATASAEGSLQERVSGTALRMATVLANEKMDRLGEFIDRMFGKCSLESQMFPSESYRESLIGRYQRRYEDQITKSLVDQALEGVE